MVVEEHHGQIVFRQFIFELPKPLKGGTAGISDEQSFLEGEFSARQGTVLIGDLFKSIDQIEVHIGGKDVFPDAFGDVGVDL